MDFIRSPVSAALSVFLGVHGLRSGSLDVSGALAAIVAGDLTLGVPDIKLFGVLMIAFYLAGSRATKFKAAYKATLEDTHQPAKRKAKTGGNRNAIQVLCNCYVGTAAAVLWQQHCGEPYSWSHARWCVLDARHDPSRLFVLTAVSFFAACAGDTFASELGILSTAEPVLITSWRKVPRGTNGGVTAWGTLVSLLGGLLIGLVAVLGLAMENKACRTSEVAPVLLMTGAVSGLLGSLIDSILGATCQASYYSKAKGKIVSRPREAKDAELIAGRDLLSNNAVNFVSTGLVAAAVPSLVSLL